jgi:hypothetical protein
MKRLSLKFWPLAPTLKSGPSMKPIRRVSVRSLGPALLGGSRRREPGPPAFSLDFQLCPQLQPVSFLVSMRLL